MTTVPELALFLTRADLLISNDTGAIHIAAAAGCRTLSLFGSTAYFAETAPWDEGHVILQGPLGSDCVLLDPRLVLAAALRCLGLMDDHDFQIEIVRQNASAWETFYLEEGTDPLRGISYRPLHRDRLSPDQIFMRELRHLFARVFCSGEPFGRSELFPAKIAKGSERSFSSPYQNRDADTGRVLAMLESMAEAAARCRILCARPTKESAAEISRLSAWLQAAIEQLKASSNSYGRIAPVIHFLDWTCRMMEQMAPEPTFLAHEQAYRLAARLLREAEWRANAAQENFPLMASC